MSRFDQIATRQKSKFAKWNREIFWEEYNEDFEDTASIAQEFVDQGNGYLFFRLLTSVGRDILQAYGTDLLLTDITAPKTCAFHAGTTIGALGAFEHILLKTDESAERVAHDFALSLLPVIPYADPRILDLAWETGRAAVTDPRFKIFIPDPALLADLEGVEYAPQQLIVFTMGLLAARVDQEIDWDSYEIPADRFYTDFLREALFTQDLALYDRWMKALCDKHLEIVSLDLDDEPRDFGHELHTTAFWLWPLEVRAVERLRRDRGLQTPEIDHPLMTTKLAALTDIECSGVEVPGWLHQLIDGMIHFDTKFEPLRQIWRKP